MSILVTRPEPEATKLVVSLQQRGFKAYALPMLERVDLPETPEIRQSLLDLDLFQQVIVVSPYGAKQLGLLVDQYWPQLPVKIQWFAIGNKTAAELSQWDIDAVCSTGVDSEALLALSSLQSVGGNKILLVKGVGGRDLLKQVLEQRGARVTELALYQRMPAQYNKSDVLSQLVTRRIDTMVATSGEIVSHLSGFLDQQWRDNVKLVVPSARVAALATSLGFSHVINAKGAGEEAILKTLI